MKSREDWRLDFERDINPSADRNRNKPAKMGFERFYVRTKGFRAKIKRDDGGTEIVQSVRFRTINAFHVSK